MKYLLYFKKYDTSKIRDFLELTHLIFSLEDFGIEIIIIDYQAGWMQKISITWEIFSGKDIRFCKERMNF